MIRSYEEAGTAEGQLWTVDGQSLTAVRQAGAGPANGGIGLKDFWRTRTTTTWHVEGHMAAIMRQREIKHAVLYINARPCEKPKGWPDITGCSATLKEVLPVGYRLTVFCRDTRFAYRRFEYWGNGKGLVDT